MNTRNYTLDWTGYFSAIPTPFDINGNLDTGSLEKLVAWFITQRPSGIVVNGTFGEWYAQTTRERIFLAQKMREIVPPEMTLLLGISSLNIDESIQLGEHAKEIGYDGVLLTLPPARKLTADEIFRYYQVISKRIQMPILVYNVPSVSCHDLSVDILLKLSTINHIIGIKDNTPNPSKRIDTIEVFQRYSDFVLFSDVLNLETLKYVASNNYRCGQIGAGMPLGASLNRAFSLIEADDISGALSIVEHFQRLKCDLLSLLEPGEQWHKILKDYMYASGLDAGYPRFPARSIRYDEDKMVALSLIADKYRDMSQ